MKIEDRQIAALNMSPREEHALRNYAQFERVFRRLAAERVVGEVETYDIDIPELQRSLQFIAVSELSYAVLSAASTVDDLLGRTFSRSNPGNLKMSELLGPLGSLGNLSKRLQVALLVGFISPPQYEFLDQLRKMRNKIAHGREPTSPTFEAIQLAVKKEAIWFDIISEERADFIRSSTDVAVLFRAALIINIANVAWDSQIAPLCVKYKVSREDVYHQKPRVLVEVISCAFEIAYGLLGLQIVEKE